MFRCSHVVRQRFDCRRRRRVTDRVSLKYPLEQRFQLAHYVKEKVLAANVQDEENDGKYDRQYDDHHDAEINESGIGAERRIRVVALGVVNTHISRIRSFSSLLQHSAPKRVDASNRVEL